MSDTHLNPPSPDILAQSRVAWQLLHKDVPQAYPLRRAVQAYLLGRGPREDVVAAWEALERDKPAMRWFSTPADPGSNTLTLIDQRVLDCCIIFNSLHVFFEHSALRGPVAAARQYVLDQGMDEALLLEQLIRAAPWLHDDRPTALGTLMLGYLRERFALLAGPLLGWYGADACAWSVEVLLALDPPEVDLAWQVARVAEARASQRPVGWIAAHLLRADPHRFREWARAVVVDPRSSYWDRYHALAALGALVPADALDGAAQMIAEPDEPGASSSLHLLARDLLVQAGQDRLLSVAEELVLHQPKSKNRAAAAFELLAHVAPEQRAPVLQRCVTELHDADHVAQAVDMLLEAPWTGQLAYAATLLTHRTKAIRARAVAWLSRQGAAVTGHVTPALAHRQAGTRLAAAHTLQRAGSVQALAALAAQLQVEQRIPVRDALFDALGSVEVRHGIIAPERIAGIEQMATATAAGHPPLPWFDAHSAPQPRWMTGAAVPPAALDELVRRQSRAKAMLLEHSVAWRVGLIDRASAGDLALALVQGWVDQGADLRQGWLLPLACALGDDRLVGLLRDRIDAWSRQRPREWVTKACRAADALFGMETPAALDQIADLLYQMEMGGRPRALPRVSKALQVAIRVAAAREGVAPGEIEDRLAPRLSCDSASTRLLAYGPRQFYVRLRPDRAIQLTDSAGQVLARLPRPTQSDDAAKAAAAQEVWRGLPKQVRQVWSVQARRLEAAMVSGRTWDVARWRDLFLAHPLLRLLAQGLVWRVGDAPAVCFRPLEDGTLTDAHDEPVLLPVTGQVRLIHPVELDEATRNAWARHLEDYEIVPPFAQVTRPMARLPEDAGAGLWWQGVRGYVVPWEAFKALFQKAGWEWLGLWQGFNGKVRKLDLQVGDEWDSAYADACVRTFPEGDVLAILQLGRLYTDDQYLAVLADVRFAHATHPPLVYEINVGAHDKRLIPLRDVPPGIVSEALVDIRAFTAAGYPAGMHACDDEAAEETWRRYADDSGRFRSLSTEWHGKGRGLEALGYLPEALAAYERAVDHDPNLVAARDDMARVLRHMGQAGG